MNDSIRVIRRSRRAWPRTARTAVAVVATTSLALLAAACASPSSNGLSGSSNEAVAANIQSTSPQQALAYSRCMRSHGVPNFPDPDSSGNPLASTKQIGASNPRFDAAQEACRRLLPNGSQPLQAKPAPEGNTQNQPPQAKPTPGGGQ